MFTGINEFKNKTSFRNLYVSLMDINDNQARYTGYSDNQDITIYCSYYGVKDFENITTITNLLNADTIRIYLDDELVLWIT